MIDEHLTAGGYDLRVDSVGGQGTYTVTTMLMPAATPFQPIPTRGFGLFSIVAGDFNGDGSPDLAVTNGYNQISVLVGNGDGTFRPAVPYAVGSTPSAIVAGDFTGNGHLDLAVANSQSDTVSVLLGNGDGTFQPQVTYEVGYGPDSIVAGDFTGDGHLDLAVAGGGTYPNYYGTVSVLLGNGDGTFQPQTTDAVGPSPIAIVTGDFNGDGHTDLAVVNSNASNAPPTGTVSVLLGNGDGTFQPQVTYAVGSSPNAIVAGDFAGNGRTDLAVTNYGDNSVSVLLGNGDGTFQPQVTYAVGLSPNSIITGDFKGDGHLDLAVAHVDVGVEVLLGNGDGTFQPAQTVMGGFCFDLVAGDFNGDGRTDLVVTSSPPYPVGIGLRVLLGNGDGTFQAPAENFVGSLPDSIVSGDFNGDGRLDLAVADAGGEVSVLLGNGDGTFQPAAQYAVGLSPSAIVTGDFNGDGRLDLAVANSGDNTVSVLLGNGDGTFQPQVTYAVGAAPVSIVAGDFTGNGRLDLAVVNSGTFPNYYGTVSVLLGNGDGTFQPQVKYPVGSAPWSIVAGDFNGDGRLDLAVANQFDNTVSVLLGNGNGTFRPQMTYAVGAQPFGIAAGNFTDDGHLDLAVANGNVFGSGAGTVSVLLGSGDGTFQPQVTYAVGQLPYGIVAGDFTGDGHVDLAVANAGDETVSVLLGNGDGTFHPQVAYTVGVYPTAIVTSDLTGDGHPDLAVTNLEGNTVSVLLGNGDGTFADPSQFATTPRSTPLVADVNGDGTDDVLVVDGHGNILYRQGIPGQPGSFEPPVTINPNNPSRDITWLPKTDQGPVLASVDAHDDAISLYAYRDGQFVRLIGSLPTGRLPAQIIGASSSATDWTTW
jgi:hypothetical protein